MKRKKRILLTGLLLAAIMVTPIDLAFSWPTIYPRGLTICKIDRVEPGYILFTPNAPGRGAILIDNLTGNIVREWRLGGKPTKLLPSGNIFLNEKEFVPGLAGNYAGDLTEFDWDGKRIWQWKGEIPGREPVTGPIHHDFCRLRDGNTLVLTVDKVKRPDISDKELMDDIFYEVTPDGKVVWELKMTDLYDQFGFTGEQKRLISNQTGVFGPHWARCNSLVVVPLNKWFDQGEQRFKPGNLIISSRDLNAICIIDRDSKKIVWKLGPDYPDGKVDQIIGQHEPYIIPKGLPGAGNMLMIDNGGESGYPRKIRGYSRVIEVNPVNKEIVWKYEAIAWGERVSQQGHFSSNYVGNAQRLSNGNTFIVEGWPGRLFEVTKEGEIVWEWLSPWVPEPPTSPPGPLNYIYRAYKYPKDYCVQFKDLKPVAGAGRTRSQKQY
ncbi:MAG: arylsulfotransferase family protein [Syntrophales bacterium]